MNGRVSITILQTSAAVPAGGIRGALAVEQPPSRSLPFARRPLPQSLAAESHRPGEAAELKTGAACIKIIALETASNKVGQSLQLCSGSRTCNRCKRRKSAAPDRFCPFKADAAAGIAVAASVSLAGSPPGVIRWNVEHRVPGCSEKAPAAECRSLSEHRAHARAFPTGPQTLRRSYLACCLCWHIWSFAKARNGPTCSGWCRARR